MVDKLWCNSFEILKYLNMPTYVVLSVTKYEVFILRELLSFPDFQIHFTVREDLEWNLHDMYIFMCFPPFFSPWWGPRLAYYSSPLFHFRLITTILRDRLGRRRATVPRIPSELPWQCGCLNLGLTNCGPTFDRCSLWALLFSWMGTLICFEPHAIFTGLWNFI